MSTVATPQTSAARRAATSLVTNSAWNEHFAAHMPHFLCRGQLVLEMDARRAGLGHLLHQFEDVQGAPKPASPSATSGANQ